MKTMSLNVYELYLKNHERKTFNNLINTEYLKLQHFT